MKGLYIGLIIVFFGSGVVLAQDYDASFKLAEKHIYKNPDKSLTITNGMLKDSVDAEQRIDIFLLQSKAYIAKRDFDASLHTILKAEKLIKSVNSVELKAKVLLSIAIQYQQMEFYNKSLDVLEQVDSLLAGWGTFGDAEYILLGKGKAVRGMILKSQSNSELALQKFEEAIASLEKVKDRTKVTANSSVIYYNMGYALLDLNRVTEAKLFFKKSKEKASEANAISLLAFSNKGLADALIIEGDGIEALSYLGEAEKQSEGIGDLVLLEGIYKLKSDAYLVSKDVSNYHKYYEKYKSTWFKRKQSELNSISSELVIQEENVNKKLKEIEERTTKDMLFLGIITFISVAIIVYLIWRLRRKNSTLEQEIRQILDA